MSDISLPNLRLLWLTENYYPSRGGMAQSCDRIVHSLRQAGVLVDVAHFSHAQQEIKIEAKRNGNYIACPVGQDPAHAMNCLWNVISADAGANPLTHIVAFGGVLPMLAGPVYAAWLGLPLITLVRGNDFDIGIFSPKRGDVLREALKRSARICAVSRDKAAKIRALFPELDPVWIPNGIDLSGWEPLPSHLSRADRWRATTGGGRRVLGMFGQIKQKKGGLFFLETLIESGHAENFHLLFVGDLEEEIFDWLARHETQIAYSLYPFVDRYDLLNHYPACDLVVIASFYDGLPNVLLEAAGLGLPLLASTAGGMADVLEEDRHGFLFYPGDRHACRRAIDEAARASSEELKRFGDNCRQLVQTQLSSHAETGRYLSLFMETLKSGDGALAGYGIKEYFENDSSTLTGEHQ